MDLVVLAFVEVHALVDAVVVLVPVHLMAAAEAAEAHLIALVVVVAVVVAVVAVAVLVRHHAILAVLNHANMHANMIVLAVVKVAVDHVKKHA